MTGVPARTGGARTAGSTASTKVFRDAVHGDIELTLLEVECLDTPEMQRLRGIKQLGTASLVYPSAVHTRFEHSLGTRHVAARILDVLESLSGIRITREERTLVGLAALLHDITHVPFGHTLEDERRVFPRHDDDPPRLGHFLGRGALGRILRREGLQKELQRILSNPAGSGKRPFLRQVVHDTICADLLDYLRRDAFFCGFSQHYDPRLYRYLRVGRGRLYFEVTKDGRLRSDALTEVVNLLRLRYNLSERVYYHHAKIASGAMISRAVESAVAAGLRQDELYPLRDDALLHLLGTRYGEIDDVRHLLDRLASRRLHRAAFTLTPAIGLDRQADLVARFYLNTHGEREALERELCREFRLAPGAVIVYCPSPSMALKEADVLVQVDPRSPRSLAEMRNAEVELLKEKHRALWCFRILVDRSVSPKSVARMEEACARRFGITPAPAGRGGRLNPARPAGR